MDEQWKRYSDEISNFKKITTNLMSCIKATVKELFSSESVDEKRISTIQDAQDASVAKLFFVINEFVNDIIVNDKGVVMLVQAVEIIKECSNYFFTCKEIMKQTKQSLEPSEKTDYLFDSYSILGPAQIKKIHTVKKAYLLIYDLLNKANLPIGNSVASSVHLNETEKEREQLYYYYWKKNQIGPKMVIDDDKLEIREKEEDKNNLAEFKDSIDKQLITICRAEKEIIELIKNLKSDKNSEQNSEMISSIIYKKQGISSLYQKIEQQIMKMDKQILKFYIQTKFKGAKKTEQISMRGALVLYDSTYEYGQDDEYAYKDLYKSKIRRQKRRKNNWGHIKLDVEAYKPFEYKQRLESQINKMDDWSLCLSKQIGYLIRIANLLKKATKKIDNENNVFNDNTQNKKYEVSNLYENKLKDKKEIEETDAKLNNKIEIGAAYVNNNIYNKNKLNSEGKIKIDDNSSEDSYENEHVLFEPKQNENQGLGNEIQPIINDGNDNKMRNWGIGIFVLGGTGTILVLVVPSVKIVFIAVPLLFALIGIILLGIHLCRKNNQPPIGIAAANNNNNLNNLISIDNLKDDLIKNEDKKPSVPGNENHI